MTRDAPEAAEQALRRAAQHDETRRSSCALGLLLEPSEQRSGLPWSESNPTGLVMRGFALSALVHRRAHCGRQLC